MGVCNFEFIPCLQQWVVNVSTRIDPQFKYDFQRAGQQAGSSSGAALASASVPPAGVAPIASVATDPPAAVDVATGDPE